MDKTAKALLAAGFVMSLVLLLAIIGTGLAMFWTGKPIPKELDTWAAIALGFIFGVVPGLVKDWIGKSS